MVGIGSSTYYQEIHSFNIYFQQKTRSPVYYDDDDLRTEWNFQISKHYNDYRLHEWSKPRIKLNEIIRLHVENESAFVPSDSMKPLMEQLQKEHNYNLLASQMISVRRSLPDIKFPECHHLLYPKKLPTTSIIIIFHNEAMSTLLRTIWSIIDTSPSELLREIILVDDFSTNLDLKDALEEYVTQLPIDIQIIRNDKREGLIRSRLIGANEAKV